MVSRTSLVIGFFLLVITGLQAISQPIQIIYQYAATLPATYKGKTTPVSLRVAVHADNSIGEVTLLSKPTSLDSLAIATVRDWVFLAAVVDDVPRDSTLDVVVEFQAPQKSASTNLPAIGDSTVTQQQLRQFVNDRTADRKLRYHQRWLKDPGYMPSENYHQLPGYAREFLVLDRGIPVQSKLVGPVHTLQMIRPFEEVSGDDNIVRVTSETYDASPAYCETYLGLGDYSMSNVAVDFRKGSVLGIPKLVGRFDYIGYDGYWIDQREKTSTFFGDLGYTAGDLNLDLSYRSQHNDVSQLALRTGYGDPIAEAPSENMSEYRLDGSYRMLLFGGLNRLTEYRDLTDGSASFHTQQAWVGANMKTTVVQGSVRALFDADTSPAGVADLESRMGQLYQNLTLYFRNGMDYNGRFIAAHPLYDSLSVTLTATARNSHRTWNDVTDNLQTRAALPGLRYTQPHWSVETAVGPEHIKRFFNDFWAWDETSTNRVRVEGGASFKYDVGKYSLFVQSRGEYLGKAVWEPSARAEGMIEITRDLNYGNFFSVGARIVGQNDYTDVERNVCDASSALDGWITFDITNAFSVSAEMYNMLGTEFYGVTNYNSTHFCATVHWVFVN